MGTQATVQTTDTDATRTGTSSVRAQLLSNTQVRKHDPFEAEAEELAEWLARGETTTRDADRPTIHKTTEAGTNWGAPIPEKNINDLRKSQGKPLPQDIREDFERRLGRDLSGVRIHDYKTARQLTRKLGAQAFAAGSDIFVAKPNDHSSEYRTLLAHEVIHTVQQSATQSVSGNTDKNSDHVSTNVQKRIEHSTATLDPKVNDLIDGHFTHRRDVERYQTALTEAAEALKADDSWWQVWRNSIEQIPDGATETPAVTRAKIDEAIEAIESSFSQIDNDRARRLSGDPVRNAAASLLADYLRLNREDSHAAYVVKRYPYSRTYYASNTVNAELNQGNTRRRFTLITLAFIRSETPNVLASYWPASLQTAIRGFMRLAPTEANDTNRAVIIATLREELPSMAQMQYTPDASLIDATISPTSAPEANELFGSAHGVLTAVRELMASVLETAQSRITAARARGEAPGLTWRNLITNALPSMVDTGLTSDDPIEKAVAQAIDDEVSEEVNFWYRSSEQFSDGPADRDDAFSQRLQSENMTYLEGYFTYSQTLRDVADALAPSLARETEAYLTLRPASEIAQADRRYDFDWLFGLHQDKASAFKVYLSTEVSPVLVTALQTARDAASANESPDVNTLHDVDGLALFSYVVSLLASILDEIAQIPESGYNREDHIQKRRIIANGLSSISYQISGQLTADRTESDEAPDAEASASDSAQDESPLIGRPSATHWEQINERALAALNQSDIQASLLVLPLPIQESSSNTLQQLQTDLDSMGDSAIDNPIIGLEPFTSRDVVNLVYQTYYRNLSRELENSLSSLGSDRGSGDLWLTGNAIRAAEQARNAPKRYIAPRAQLFIYNRDPHHVSSMLAERDPRIMDFTASLPRTKQFFTDASWRPSRGNFWLWTWDFPTQLIDAFYSVTVLRGLVYLIDNNQMSSFDSVDTGNFDDRAQPIIHHSATVTTLEQAALAGSLLPDTLPTDQALQWMSTLLSIRNIDQIVGGANRSQAERAADPAEFVALQGHIRDSVSPVQESISRTTTEERIRAETLLRRATTADRVVVRGIIEDQFARYEHGDIRTETILSTALDNLYAFDRSVSPNDDRERALQTTALIVELISQIERVFGSQEVLLFFEADPQHLGSNQRSAYFLFRQALDNLDGLSSRKPASQNSEPIPISEHSEGIAMPEGGFANEVDELLLQWRIDRARSVLREATQPMIERTRGYQWMFGITGRAGSQTLTSHINDNSIFSAEKIERDNQGISDEADRGPLTFRLDGLDIKIVRVLRDFTYLPGAGDRSRATGANGQYALYSEARVFTSRNVTEDNWESTTADVMENPRAAYGTTPVTESSGPNEDLVRVQLFFGEQPLTEEFNLSSHQLAGSEAGLVWLMDIVHRRVNLQGLEALGAVIEGFGQAMLFVASLHPATRGAVMAVEAMQLVMEVMQGESFVQQLEALKNEPTEVVQRVADRLAERFTIDGVFDMLLNGNFDAPDFANRSTRQGQRSERLNTSGGRGRSKVQRILGRIRRLGVVAALRLESFQGQVQGPVRIMEASIARNPIFASLLSWMGDNAETLVSGDPDAYQDLILRHPIAGPIYELYLLQQERLAMHLPDNDDTSFMTALGSSIGGFIEQFNASLQAAQSFELPDEIFPLEPAIDALIEAIIHGLQRIRNTKARIAATAAELLKEGADVLGLSEYAESYIAAQLRDTVVDPNYYWKNNILPQIQVPVESTIQSAATQVSDLLASTPLIGPLVTQSSESITESSSLQASVSTNPELDETFVSSEANALAGTLEDSEEQETGPSMSSLRSLPGVAISNLIPREPVEAADGGDTPDSGDTSADSAGGSPAINPHGSDLRSIQTAARAQSDNQALDSATRHKAERSFGHSFRDVRLSRGPTAGAAAARNGVDGLTRGNHILMRPDLSLHSQRGQQVLNHELSHVLQKREGAKRSQANPQSTHSLRIRPSEEAGANKMAESASRPHRSGPVSVEGAHREGASPSVSGTLLKSFIQNISSPSAGTKLNATAQRAHMRGQDRPDNLDTDVRRQAKRIWDAIVAKIDAKQLSGGPDYLENAETRRMIAEHLKTRIGSLRDLTSAGNVVYYLAAERQYTRSGRKRMNVSGFLEDLALYIGGRSGVLLDFSNKRTIARQSTSRQPTVSIEIEHLELYLVRATRPQTNDLWEKAIRNTWTAFPGGDPTAGISEHQFGRLKTATENILAQDFGSPVPPSATAGGEDTGATATPASDAAPDREAIYSRAWNRSANDLKFNSAFKGRVNEEINPPGLSETLLPPWRIYVGENRSATAAMDGHAAAKQELERHPKASEFPATDRDRVAGVGVHLGTHHEFSATHIGTFKLGPNDRNSHHITQYLLPEYFHNEKPFQPFPNSGAYPGVTKSGAAVSKIKDKSTNAEIDVAGTESPGRGGPMPAILLSAHAHQNSRLHVTPKGDDDVDASQGFAIHREFKQRLQVQTGQANWVDAEAYLRTSSDSEATRSHKLYEAVRATYDWIWNTEMKDDLTDRMPNVEAQYYMNQFPTSDPARRQRFEAINQGDIPTVGDISTAIENKVRNKAIPHMVSTLDALGWKLP